MGKLADLVGPALCVNVRLIETAIDADIEKAVFYAQEKYKILSAGFVPDTAYTGADTNTRDIGLVNKGTTGVGTTAVKAAINLTNGVNIAAMDYKELVLAADEKTILAGQVISFKSTHAGDGIVLPAGNLVLYLQPMNI